MSTESRQLPDHVLRSTAKRLPRRRTKPLVYEDPYGGMVHTMVDDPPVVKL